MKRLSSRDYAELLYAAAAGVDAGRRVAVVRNFLQLVRRQRAVKLLPRIVDHLQKLDDQVHGRTRVRIGAGSKMEAAWIAKQMTKLAGQAIVELRHQPELLGGITVRIGDTEIDGSIRRQLTRLRTHLIHPTHQSTTDSVGEKRLVRRSPVRGFRSAR